MTKTDMQQLAISIALRLSLDPALVQAVCHHESSWNPNAERYEPAFFHRYIDSMKGLSDEEKRLRATSIGLMQVMGQVAREQGFDDPLTELHDPAKCIEQGCKKLAKCIRQTVGVREALLAYNGGGAKEYPDLVLAHYDLYKDDFRATVAAAAQQDLTRKEE